MGIPIFLEVGNSVFRPLAFSTFHPLGIPIFRSLRNSSYHFHVEPADASTSAGMSPVEFEQKKLVA